MKARVKATGEVVEVEKITSFLRDFGNGGERRYEADELDIPITREDILESAEYWKAMYETLRETTPTDWQVYRMEVAKECMANMMSFVDGRHFDDDCDRLSAWAVKMADALIARLKEQKGE